MAIWAAWKRNNGNGQKVAVFGVKFDQLIYLLFHIIGSRL
jgi:hypothetical protein